jgi:hypothetical protein
MASYDCPRCGYTTEKKCNIKKHLELKKPCKPILLDINLKEYESIIFKDYNTLDLVKKIEQLKNQLSIVNRDGTQNVNVNSNNTNNTNITNHITINIKPYDNPELGYITEQDIKKCLKSLDTAMLEIGKKLYFNSDHPENNSIYKTTMKNKLIKYFKDNKWNVGDQDVVINTMVENIKDAMDQCVTDDKVQEKCYDLSDKYDSDQKFKNKVDRSLIAECYNNKPNKKST